MNCKDFEKNYTQHKPENIEWTQTYAYNADDVNSPRVLLIGDSIVLAYHNKVRELLASKVNVTFWSTSKSNNAGNYIRELDYIIDCGRFDAVAYNCGAHASVADIESGEYADAYENTLNFIKAKLPDARMFTVLTTPNKSPALGKYMPVINKQAIAISEKLGLDCIDLYTPTVALGDAAFHDSYHFMPPAVEMQARIVADKVADILSDKISGGLEQKSNEKGPDGFLK